MTATTTAVDADQALKAKHRAMWASGDYPELATDLISSLGPVLVQACGVRGGARVLDVGAGSGNAAIPAALAGADVIASDLTPELFDRGRAQARERGAELSWVEADAEALPFPDERFDTVMSCVGVMFAPHHQASADELNRVCRPGGTIGLLNWTPEGFVGQLFATMKPYAPAPPPGARPAPLWGSEDHVRALFGGRVHNIVARRRTVAIKHFTAPGELRRYFKSHYGPTISVYKAIAGEPERVAQLDHDIDQLAARFQRFGSNIMEWEYLLLTGTRG